MTQTKTLITYNVVLNPEFILNADSKHNSYTQAQQAIDAKITEFYNNMEMSADNKAYWLTKYKNAVIVEEVSTYTVIA